MDKEKFIQTFCKFVSERKEEDTTALSQLFLFAALYLSRSENDRNDLRKNEDEETS